MAEYSPTQKEALLALAHHVIDGSLPFTNDHARAVLDIMAKMEAGIKGSTELVAKSKALVESVYGDNAHNGDILSRETIKAADTLRMEIDKWK